jgi:NADH-quinone oxidoreductase subunit J
MTALDIILVAALVVSSLVTVMMARLLWAIICLATTSVIVTMVMFRFDSPIAAVFELSVCAGLIPAIFLSAISLTRRLTPEEVTDRRREKFRRFWLLPVLVAGAGVALWRWVHVANFTVTPSPETDVRNVLWGWRHIDLVGQVVILLGGAFAVVILLKELKEWKRAE